MTRKGKKLEPRLICRVCKNKLLHIRHGHANYKCNYCNIWYFLNFHGKLLIVEEKTNG